MTVYNPIPCRARKSVVENAAEMYAERVGFKPGASIENIVDRLGGSVFYKSFHGENKYTESIEIDGVSDFSIYIPQDTSVRRDRFTIAHELAHYLLHYPVVQEKYGNKVAMTATRYLPEDDDKDFDDLERCEWEANWFAAAFLMPSKDFKVEWQKAKDADLDAIEQTADFFRVTQTASKIRAKRLGLI